MKKVVSFVLLIPILFVMGCASNTTQVNTEDAVKQLSIEDLKDMLNDDETDVIFVDVRESSEYEEGHIEGFKLFPLSTLTNDYKEIPKDKEIVIICRSGNRSMQAVNILEENGYNQLTNVTEGMLGWDGKVVTLP